MSSEQYIFIFAGVSALADFLAIMREFGVLRKSDMGGVAMIGTGRKWILPSILFVVTIGLCAYGFQKIGELQTQVEGLKSPAPTVITIPNPAWGTSVDRKTHQPSGCYQVEVTDKISVYAKKYNLYLACGLDDPTIDRLEDTRIAISSGFNITAQPMQIAITFPPEFVRNIKNSNGSIWQQPFLLPKGTEPSRVTRLSDVHKEGGLLPGDSVP